MSSLLEIQKACKICLIQTKVKLQKSVRICNLIKHEGDPVSACAVRAGMQQQQDIVSKNKTKVKSILLDSS